MLCSAASERPCALAPPLAPLHGSAAAAGGTAELQSWRTTHAQRGSLRHHASSRVSKAAAGGSAPCSESHAAGAPHSALAARLRTRGELRRMRARAPSRARAQYELNKRMASSGRRGGVSSRYSRTRYASHVTSSELTTFSSFAHAPRLQGCSRPRSVHASLPSGSAVSCEVALRAPQRRGRGCRALAAAGRRQRMHVVA